MISLLVSLLTLTGLVLGNQCPANPDVIHGCSCSGDRISCYPGDVEIDLEDDFRTISHGFSDGQQQWEHFELSSNVMEELPSGLFHGVWFRQIHLNNNPKLACVNSDAFRGMQQFTYYFLSRASNLSTNNPKSGCDIFGALSNLQILQQVNITGSQIAEIPERAFQGVGGRQDYLTNIDFSGGIGGSLTAVRAHAFSDLRNIRNIDLSLNKITTIDPLAFAFTELTGTPVIINLEQNTGLTGGSFGSSAFGAGNRVINLMLGHNKDLQYLKQDVFYTFLGTTGNTIDLTGSGLCYCKENAWLHDLKDDPLISNRLKSPLMIDGVSLWQVPKSKFSSDAPTVGTTPSAGGSSTAAGTGSSTAGTGSNTAASGSSTTTSGSSTASSTVTSTASSKAF